MKLSMSETDAFILFTCDGGKFLAALKPFEIVAKLAIKVHYVVLNTSESI